MRILIAEDESMIRKWSLYDVVLTFWFNFTIFALSTQRVDLRITCTFFASFLHIFIFKLYLHDRAGHLIRKNADLTWVFFHIRYPLLMNCLPKVEKALCNSAKSIREKIAKNMKSQQNYWKKQVFFVKS